MRMEFACLRRRGDFALRKWLSAKKRQKEKKHPWRIVTCTLTQKEILTMNSKTIFAISIAFAAFALVPPVSARAQNPTNASGPAVSANAAKREASRMVPAQAVLDNGIDAKKMQPGEQFRATLRATVLLKNGVELPRDTVLVGTITTDRMGGGTSTLALRFTEAQMKDGKTVPIQADIMGVAGPAQDAFDSRNPGYTLSPWDGKTTQIDQVGALSGFDFHGSIGSRNSGLFVSKKKDEMNLRAGSRISLAIAAAQSA
jgi:hypothetical protein